MKFLPSHSYVNPKTGKPVLVVANIRKSAPKQAAIECRQKDGRTFHTTIANLQPLKK